jgi:prepilin-type N-terminal cleavage/methylation domain-containing protein
MNKQTLSPLKKGFTLTELLITVGLIGIVSAISLPGILSGVETSNRRAIFKDTLKILNEAAEALTLRPDVTTDTYLAVVSAVRTLDKDDTARTITLHSGATLSGFSTAIASLGRCDTIMVDLNGSGQPNTAGQDQVSITTSWEPNNGNACGTLTNPITGGMVRPTAGVGGNQAFYRELTR